MCGYPEDMRIEVLADGRPVVTTTEAAKQLGYTPAGLRATLAQNGIEPVARLDSRTPLWDLDVLTQALAARPGLGAPGKPRKRRAA